MLPLHRIDTPIPSSPTKTKIKYRSIPEGHGGTYHSNPDLNHAGTTNCLTCIGVYLPISAQRYFLAHINPFITTSYFPDGSPVRRRRSELRTEELQKIRGEVKRKLEEHASDNGWTKDSVLHSVADGKRSIIIVCERMEDEPGRPGPAVVRGLGDFLGQGEEFVGECRRGFVGFVVDHGDGGNPVIFGGMTARVEREVLGGYEAVEEGRGEMGWDVGVER